VLAMDRVNLRALRRHRPRDDAREGVLFLEHVGFEGLDEVPDPYYGGRRDFERVLDLARRGTALLIERLNAREDARA
jgi:protein-tyrosine phosphatase